MRNYLAVFFCVWCMSSLQAQLAEQAVSTTLDAWHKAAANADFDAYFSLMATDARYIGTDPTENWSVEDFKDFAKPYFDRGAAWNFQPVQRNIYVDSSGKLAWFDELLTGWMYLCRGSGVLALTDGKWKIKHYVLSMTIPNKNTNDVIKLKQAFDQNLLQKLDKK